MHKDKLKILLAEDDLHLGMLLVDYLEAEGFDVKLCSYPPKRLLNVQMFISKAKWAKSGKL